MVERKVAVYFQKTFPFFRILKQLPDFQAGCRF
jgi:hypothetical protein